jgi:hypothetical protein
MRLSASRTYGNLSSRIFLELISVGGRVKARAVLPLEGLGQLKNAIASSEIESIIIQFVAEQLDYLCYSVQTLVKIEKKWKIYVPYKAHLDSNSIIFTSER